MLTKIDNAAMKTTAVWNAPSREVFSGRGVLELRILKASACGGQQHIGVLLTRLELFVLEDPRMRLRPVFEDFRKVRPKEGVHLL